MAFVYEGWPLYRRDIKKTNGEIATIYFFSKRNPREGIMCDLPEGYRVEVMKRSGLPIVVKNNKYYE